MASLAGKRIALTGGGSGIGLATAMLLADRGAILSICDIDQAKVHDAVKQLSGKGHFGSRVDVSKASQVNAWIDATVDKLGGIDGAANIAGIEHEGGRHFADARDEDWDLVMGVNCSGVFYSMRAQIRKMMEKGGSIVNVASIAGLIGVAETTCYNASKFAVIGLTRTAAREYGSHNIRVNSVAPGVIATPMVRAMETGHRLGTVKTSQQALDRQADPKEVANVIVFLLSDEASFVTGSTYKVDGGWTA